MVKKTNWYRNFSNPELLFLSGALIGVFLLIFYFGGVLAPVFAAIILAYLLDTPMRFLHKCLKIPNAIAAFLVLYFFGGDIGFSGYLVIAFVVESGHFID